MAAAIATDSLPSLVRAGRPRSQVMPGGVPLNNLSSFVALRGSSCLFVDISFIEARPRYFSPDGTRRMRGERLKEP